MFNADFIIEPNNFDTFNLTKKDSNNLKRLSLAAISNEVIAK
jgi:hypothetical protein